MSRRTTALCCTELNTDVAAIDVGVYNFIFEVIVLWKQANAEGKENVHCNYGTWRSSSRYFSAEECVEPGVVGPVDFRMTKAIYDQSQ